VDKSGVACEMTRTGPDRRKGLIMKVLDYRNAFAIYSSACEDVPRNTCRVQILARCTLIEHGEPGKAFHLGKECIGEYCYDAERGIAQEPTSEVCLIFCEGPTALAKKFAGHERDVVQIADMGQKRKGFDGSRSHWTDLRYILPEEEGTALGNAEEVIASTLEGAPMVGRTTLTDEARGRRAVLEYPIPYINVHPPIARFQVDVGPILFPDLASDEEPPVARLELAYVMFNEFDKAEFALRVPTRIGEDEAAVTLHYSKVVRMEATNELFRVGE